MLLDLTAAFNTVDHSILLSCLESCVCIRVTAQKWFQSYLSNTSFTEHLGQYSLSVSPLKCGICQGSLLGPILFSLYMLLLGSIVCADDVQIYLPLHNSHASVNTLMDCLRDSQLWLETKFLKEKNNLKAKLSYLDNSTF